MTTKTIVSLFLVLLVILAWASWMFRYEALNPTEGRPGFPPILDRWTGEVLFVGEWWPVHDIASKEAEMEARRRSRDADIPAAPAAPQPRMGFTPIER